jgi:hypothetical protein
MHYGDSITLYRNDGSAVSARQFYLLPSDNKPEGLVSDDGRIIYSGDGVGKIFWFKDTREKLYRDKPS